MPVEYLFDVAFDYVEETVIPAFAGEFS